MRRSRDKIISEILKVCLDGANKTKIVYKVNLNFMAASRYLEVLIKHGFIEMSDGKYKTKEKGKQFLNSYQDIQDLI